MNIVHILRNDPFSGLALLLCLGTIYWCIRAVRRCRVGTDRLLLGMLGLIATSQGLRLLKEAGVVWMADGFHRLNAVANLTTATLYLVGVLLLEISIQERLTAEVGLRLAEAQPGERPAALPGRAISKEPWLVVNTDGCIVDCSNAAEAALGCKRQQLLGQKLTVSA